MHGSHVHDETTFMLLYVRRRHACMMLLILRGTSANCIFLLNYFDDNSNSFRDDSHIGRKLSTAGKCEKKKNEDRK
jgi:hypothetical protein